MLNVKNAADFFSNQREHFQHDGFKTGEATEVK